MRAMRVGLFSGEGAMRVAIVVAMLVASHHGALAQNATDDAPPADAPGYPDQAPPPGGAGGMGSMGPMAGMQAQQEIMSALAGVVLEFQSANAWSSYVSYVVQMRQADERNDDEGSDEDSDEDSEFVLEEDEAPHSRNLEAQSFYGYGYGTSSASYRKAMREQERKMYGGVIGSALVELKSEEALSHCLKIMWIQAAKQLETSQHKYYQNKVFIAMLASSGLMQHPYMSSVMMLMYYRTILDTMASAVAITRQDSWTHWNHHEMIETINFKDQSIPSDFNAAMHKLKMSAMQTWNMQTSIDIQGLMIDMYLNMMVSQLAGGSMAAGAGAGPAAGAASFLEEEAEAEPAEPTQQAGSMGPQMASYWMYMLQMMNLYSRYMEHSAAQSITTASYMSEPTSPDFDKKSDYVTYLEKAGLMALVQWAQLKQLVAYYNMFFAWYGTGGFGSMAGPGASSGSLGAALGGSFGGPSGSLLGGALGSSFGSLVQQDAHAAPSLQNQQQ